MTVNRDGSRQHDTGGETMRIPEEVARLYDHAGPFATAYLDATRASEHGAEQVRLRWLALRAELAAAGADEPTLAAMDESADSVDDHVAGEHGRVLVGGGGEVLLAATLPRAPVHSQARWAPLPHLMPFLVQQGPRIAHVVVVADRAGADVSAASAAMTAAALPAEPEHVDGSHDYPLHKAASADWSERHFHQYVENNWAANAREVAGVVARLAAHVDAGLVVVAGEQRARGLLRDDLPGRLPPGVEVVDVSDGSRDARLEHGDLVDAVHGVLLRRDLREREQTLERLREAQGHGLAVQGIAPVLDALQRAQVDTLVVVDEPTARVHAWVGPEATQLARDAEDLQDLGVDAPQPDRLDAAMLRALARTAGSLLTVPPADLSLPDGVAALLRYSDASTPA